MLSATFRSCSRLQRLSSSRLSLPLGAGWGTGSLRPNAVCYKSSRFFSQSPKEGVKSTVNATEAEKSFLQRFLAPKEMPKRGTFAWYREMVLICTVFAITGTSTMILVRPAVKNVLRLEGSFKEGPWSYRIASLVIMSPIYSVLLVAVGTVFGR